MYRTWKRQKQLAGWKKEVWIKKLVGFGSDGAAVMTGKNGGVIAKLKGVHCHAHRLELAFKDAFKKQPLHDKVTSLLFGLYYFYCKSSLNRSMLKKMFDALVMKHIMPTQVDRMHWLPHTLQVLDNLWNLWNVIP